MDSNMNAPSSVGNSKGKQPRPTQRRLIVEQFDPFRPKPGGIDTCIRGLIKYAPSNVEIWVIGVDAIGDKVLGQWVSATVDGREFRFMPAVRLDHANLKRRVPHSLRLNFVAFTRRSVAKFDVVQTHRVNAGFAAMVRYPRTKKVMLVHSSGTANLSRASKSFFKHARWLYRALEYSTVPRMDAVVIFSEDGAKRLSNKFNNVYFSPTWYDSDRFFPDPQKSESTRHKYLWACRVEPAKNPRLAIRIFARLPKECVLTVAGDGTMLPAMKEEAVALGVDTRVSFLGEVPKDDVGDLMRQHDVLMMSSEFEGFSRSIVEGLACGLPVMTTEGGDPNGLVVDGLNGSRCDTSEDAPRAHSQVLSVSGVKCVESVAALSAREIVPTVLGR